MKLGQYVHGDSVIHALDPRTKIICCTLAVVSVMISVNVYYLLVLLSLMLAVVMVSRLNLGFILKCIYRIKALLLVTLLCQGLLTHGQPVIIIGGLALTKEGLAIGAINILRLVVLFVGSLILLMTTTPIKLSTGIEALMSPLRRLNIPVQNLTTILGISFRFLPTVFEEATIVKNAQRSRGAQFDSPRIMVKIKSYAAIVIPLFNASLTRAADLGEAMDSRCYNPHPNLLRLGSLKMQGRDFTALTIAAVLFLVAVATTIYPM
ncbi:MAG TPA: energy-coupling factor transporter transmembrane protein EcfT [Syntrophothermus lipocalidus]|uniref:Cobalt transport protein n=1 Tax=Syntrophothermus lipocalidus (strain DSM 12680 / TGB-C1) TaxID=643648 RepID=D7CJC2_SYNLT|nr:energy-coupling factor transporter transmembrane component T [Syntrophothermus lipocalidus]ADI01011.1 cobalt transport protein [Syntrophothermus lipocalidus DSM 12680]HHV77679.1 energy-coupling factor transporter transmembrane protein EcfT [Syntrophothermus lipocalidus]HOV43134.1 energy-coupling factor transporter transmembrane component T [Syntrophothermus lipocalidus]